MTSRTRIGRGSLTGSMRVRTDNLPSLRGAATIEAEVTLKPGSRVYLSAWIKHAAGVPFLSIVFEQGDGGGRLR